MTYKRNGERREIQERDRERWGWKRGYKKKSREIDTTIVIERERDWDRYDSYEKYFI
jgi:hypothetical protein